MRSISDRVRDPVKQFIHPFKRSAVQTVLTNYKNTMIPIFITFQIEIAFCYFVAQRERRGDLNSFLNKNTEICNYELSSFS